MKMFKSVENLGIETFEELKEFQDLLIEKVTLGMAEQKTSIPFKWKQFTFTINLDSDDFLFGFTYGTAMAFIESKCNLTENYTDFENE